MQTLELYLHAIIQHSSVFQSLVQWCLWELVMPFHGAEVHCYCWKVLHCMCILNVLSHSTVDGIWVVSSRGLSRSCFYEPSAAYFFVHRCKYLHLLYPWGWNCCIIRLANVRLEWLISNCFPERLDWLLPHQESVSFHRSAASPALCAISLFNCRHSVRVCSGVSFWF